MNTIKTLSPLFNVIFKKNPLASQMIISGLCFGLGDVIY